MPRPFEHLQFWEQAPGEDPWDWRDRLLDDAILVGAETFPLGPQLGLRALNGFLSHPDSKARLIAVRALTSVGADSGDEDTDRHLLALLEDESAEIRAEAVRCCRLGNARESVPVLLRMLANDETARRGLRDSAPATRPALSRELFSALEEFDVLDAVPLLESLGIRSRYLTRRSRADAFVGRYVKVPGGHTPLLPAQDLSLNPLCPICNQPLRIIAVLRAPYGPGDGAPVPFYRCLSCTTHSPSFVLLSTPPTCLEKPAADSESGFRGPDPGTLGWALEWTPRKADAEIHPYTPLLGGETDWVQAEETPACPRCHERMDFAVKLPGESEQFPLVEYQGVVYGFWCGGCRVTAALFQV